MKTFSIWLPQESEEKPPFRSICFIKEGFIWPALLFGVFWMLYRKLWLPALAVFLLNILLSFIQVEVIFFSLSIPLSIIIGFIAKDILRWDCENKNYTKGATIEAKNEKEAIYLYGLK